jgi:hypothetical protein
LAELVFVVELDGYYRVQCVETTGLSRLHGLWSHALYGARVHAEIVVTPSYTS